jgi:hypothetical protein
MIEYPKIYGPYKRHVEGPDRHKLELGKWTRYEFQMKVKSCDFYEEAV